MRDACQVLVYVRTEPMVTDVHRAERPVPATIFPPSAVIVPRFEYVSSPRRRFDGVSLAALEGAREVARRSGGEVRFMDLARFHPLLRFLWAVRRAGPLPVVVLKGRCTWPRAGEAGAEPSAAARGDAGRRSIA